MRAFFYAAVRAFPTGFVIGLGLGLGIGLWT